MPVARGPDNVSVDGWVPPAHGVLVRGTAGRPARAGERLWRGCPWMPAWPTAIPVRRPAPWRPDGLNPVAFAGWRGGAASRHRRLARLGTVAIAPGGGYGLGGHTGAGPSAAAHHRGGPARPGDTRVPAVCPRTDSVWPSTSNRVTSAAGRAGRLVGGCGGGPVADQAPAFASWMVGAQRALAGAGPLRPKAVAARPFTGRNRVKQRLGLTGAARLAQELLGAGTGCRAVTPARLAQRAAAGTGPRRAGVLALPMTLVEECPSLTIPLAAWGCTWV